MIYSSNNKVYPSIRALAKEIHRSRDTISNWFKEGNESFSLDGITYSRREESIETPPTVDNIPKMDKEYQEFLKYKESKDLDFEKYSFDMSVTPAGNKYAIALFSDAHIEETVYSTNVLGLNEYNLEVAEKRIQTYFKNLVTCLNRDNVDYLVFASLGDTISGFIHEELAQNNGMTPLEATLKAQSLIYGGLEYICKYSDVDGIKFIGIVGNHSRVTKKIQHSNGYKMSYEWIMYQNIKEYCALSGLPIEFDIPQSEMAVLDMFDSRRFIFIHGYQIKSSGTGTVCGIYPALQRLALKWDRVFHQDKIYLGHFHSCTSIPTATVNGSIIGFNTYSLSNGFTYEEPAQMYEVWDSNKGLILTRKIYCN